MYPPMKRGIGPSYGGPSPLGARMNQGGIQMGGARPPQMGGIMRPPQQPMMRPPQQPPMGGMKQKPPMFGGYKQPQQGGGGLAPSMGMMDQIQKQQQMMMKPPMMGQPMGEMPMEQMYGGGGPVDKMSKMPVDMGYMGAGPMIGEKQPAVPMAGPMDMQPQDNMTRLIQGMKGGVQGGGLGPGGPWNGPNGGWNPGNMNIDRTNRGMPFQPQPGQDIIRTMGRRY